MDISHILSKCTVERERIIKLPPVQLNREEFLSVSKKMQDCGGAWNFSARGFLFDHDPSPYLKNISGSSLTQLLYDYSCPPDVAKTLIGMAQLKRDDIVLEPSAGSGTLVAAAYRIVPSVMIDCFEPIKENRYTLSKMRNVHLLGKDFMAALTQPRYDKIIAYPPADREMPHILRMYQHLRKTGILISICSTRWKTPVRKEENDFRKFLLEKQVRSYPVAATLPGMPQAEILLLQK